jgi:hypothetical protein
VRTGDDRPVIAVEVDRVRSSGLELDQRAPNDLVPELLDAPGERLDLLGRTGDDHAQPLRGGTHP